MTTSDIRTIPLNQLTAWADNVRKARASATPLAELAASIAAHGVLQSLVVKPAKRNRFAVVAGCRRLLALRALVEAGRITPDHAVPCQVLGADADATEASLAENTMREAMHPADEFEAFRRLTDAGMPVADIAARFGTTETVVAKRLRLARVAPVIVDAYRRDELTLEEVMAFAVTDDTVAQEALWNTLPEHRRHAHSIRQALTEGDIPATDKRVRFVTLKAYMKAGGTTRRDLFTDGDHGIFILNAALLEQLVATRLEKAAAKIRKEGWSWVEAHPDFGYEERSRFTLVFQAETPLPPELEAEAQALCDEQDAFYDVEGELTDEQQARYDAIGKRLDEIENSRELVWPDGTVEMAGAIVSIAHDGSLNVERGLIRPENAKQLKAKRADAASATVGERIPALPAKLVETLTAHRSAAISAELLQHPDVALAALAHALALPFIAKRGSTCLQVSLTAHSQHRVEDTPAATYLGDARTRWQERMPQDSDALFAWCLVQERETLLELLTFCAAASVDTVVVKSGLGRQSADEIAQADLLARALQLDIAKWFTPTADNFFSHVSKPQIVEALQEGRGAVAPAWTKLKRPELAALAERELAGRSWLPEMLRAPASQAAVETQTAA